MPGYVLNATELIYGTAPAAGWWEHGLSADTFKSRQDVLKRNVLRRQTSAPTLGDRRIIDKGGEGSIELDVGSNGMGMFLGAAASSTTEGVVDGGTLAFEQVFNWGTSGPPEFTSIATEVYRSQQDGGIDVWRYSGGTPTSVEFGQSLDGFLTFKAQMDYLHAQRLGSDPARTPVTIVPDWLYAWPDATITLTPVTFPAGVRTLGSGVAECLSSFSLTLPGGLDTEAWCLKRGTSKHRPTRSGTPEPDGTLEWKYQDHTYYDAFRSGAPFKLTANWQGPTAIEDTTYPALTIDVATIVFEDANDPEAKGDGPTEQSMPFKVVDDEGGNPVATVTIVTSDELIFSNYD